MAYQPTPEEKSSAMLSHLLCIFTWWLGPLIMFLIKKDQSPYVKLHSKQALVWGIAINIAIVISYILVMVLIGCILVPAVLVVHYLFTIKGTIKVNKGEEFIYPWLGRKFCKDEIALVYGEGEAVTSAAGPTPPPPAGPSA